MADHKQEEAFKVVDRRHFTAEGELRKEVLEEERREQEAAAAARKPAAAASTPKPAGPQPPGAAGGTVSGGTAPGAGAETPQPSHSFQMLVDFLARNAAVMLGGYADPSTGQAILDLDGAREFVDIDRKSVV